MELDMTQPAESNHIPVWCVGHQISNPDKSMDAILVDAEGNSGVSR